MKAREKFVLDRDHNGVIPLCKRCGINSTYYSINLKKWTKTCRPHCDGTGDTPDYSLKDEKDAEDFKAWKIGQEDNISKNGGWTRKWECKRTNARNDSGNTVKCLLTLNEYLFKAFQAGLTDPKQIGLGGQAFNLARINDTGDYTVESCRFITFIDNQHERRFSIESSRALRLGRMSRDTVKLIFQSSKTIDEISKDVGVDVPTIEGIKSGIFWSKLTRELL